MNPKTLGRYQLLRLLGQGAMGRVYEGHDPNLDRRVAVKTILVDNLSPEEASEYERRFRIEARSIARLQHPHIVSVYDCDREGGTAYLVMEYVAGLDLKHRLANGARFTLAQIGQILTDLLSALDYAHRQNIVHRDVKPANLLIEDHGRLKLTDFGIARMEDAEDATRTRGAMLGTLKYMSPEQVQGLPTGPATDIYSCGIVLYELLTGVRPFDGSNDFELLQKIVSQEAPAPTRVRPALPPEMDALVLRALAKAPADRYASAAEMATAIRDVWDALPADLLNAPADTTPANPVDDNATTRVQLPVDTSAEEPSSASSTSTSTLPPIDFPVESDPLPRRSRKRAWMVVTALVLVFVSAFVVWWNQAGEPTPPPLAETPVMPAPTEEPQPPELAAPGPSPIVTESPAETTTAEPVKPPIKAANKASAPTPAAKPKLCANRSIFTYGFCMNRECEKAENAKTPACVKWHAESDRLRGGGPNH